MAYCMVYSQCSHRGLPNSVAIVVFTRQLKRTRSRDVKEFITFIKKPLHEYALKGPKREIFDFGVFAQIRPIWIGDLGTRPKNYKFLWFRHENRHFILISAVAYNAKKL